MFRLYPSTDAARYSAFAIVLFVFFLGTQNYVDANAVIAVGFGDTETYIAIAECLKDRDCGQLHEYFPSHRLARWLPNIAAGYISEIGHLSLPHTYRLLVLGLMLASTFLIAGLSVPLGAKQAYLALVLLAPYGFRSCFFAPAMIADALFYFCVLVVVYALIERKYFALLAALVVACFCRQTTALLVPILLACSFFRLLSLQQAIIAGGVVIVGLIVNQILTTMLFGATVHSTIYHLYGVFQWASSAGNLGELAGFLGAFVLLPAILAPVLLLNRERMCSWLVMVAVVLFALQPLLAGPAITGGNAPRLLAYCVPFVGLLFLNRPQASIGLFVGAMLLLSLHYNYSVLGNRLAFGVLVILTATGAVVVYLRKRGVLRRMAGAG